MAQLTVVVSSVGASAIYNTCKIYGLQLLTIQDTNIWNLVVATLPPSLEIRCSSTQIDKTSYEFFYSFRTDEIETPPHTLATRNPLDTDPPDWKHRGMVVDVQEWYLAVLLAQDEEYCVDKLQQFGEVEPPDGLCNLPTNTRRFVVSEPDGNILN